MSFSCGSPGVAAAADEPTLYRHYAAAQSATAGSAVDAAMDAPSSSSPYLSTAASGRYAGVARYLESLEMAGSDLEMPPSHPDTYNDKPDDFDDRSLPQQQAAGAAKPEMKDDDVTHGSDSSPMLRHRRQVVNPLLHKLS